MLHWVLQSNLFREHGYQDLIQTLIQENYTFSLHKVVPFTGELIPDISPDCNVICLGSVAMRHIAKRKGWTPGVFDLSHITQQDMIDNWDDWMLNSDAITCKFCDVEWPDEETRFVKPDGDNKLFAGCLMKGSEFSRWKRQVDSCKDDLDSRIFDKETLITISSPKQIYKEARFFIVKDRIVTQSEYKIGDRVAYSNLVDTDMIKFASACVTPMSTKYWSPSLAYVLDIALTEVGCKIIEINTINCAGLYKADVQKLVHALSDTTSPTY